MIIIETNLMYFYLIKENDNIYPSQIKCRNTFENHIEI